MNENKQRTITLSELLPHCSSVSLPPADVVINGLAIDSREVQPGGVFIAYPGLNADGRHFIYDAVERGAIAILAEAADFIPPQIPVPLILIENLAAQLSLLAARFYQYPAKQLAVIGVTGTNGKTSCTQFIARALTRLNKPCGVIGTLGYGFPGYLTTHSYTTPDALQTQKIAAELAANSAQAIAMEVSSHALAQDRVSAIDFHTAVFTNLTHDHLDYHGSMENYAQAKRRLFESSGLRYAVINVDDPFGVQLAKEFADKLTVYTYGLEHSLPSIARAEAISVRNINFTAAGLSAEVTTPWGMGVLQSSLLGKFNLSNLLAVLAVLCIQGVTLEQALQQLSLLTGVPGRMQTLGGGVKPLVVIDYAHTPDALQQVVTALRAHCQGRLWCVFGCGGNRDRAKRSLMGYIAQQYADQIILTDDNPRHEAASQIIADIMQGISANACVVIEHDRRRAIEHALACAKPEDIVLIAGKGHETYQQIGDEKLPFSDEVEVKLLLE